MNKPVFVLTVKLLEVRQLNSPLLFPAPLVESLQTHLKDNARAPVSAAVSSAVTTQSWGLSGQLMMSILGTLCQDLAFVVLFSHSVTGEGQPSSTQKLELPFFSLLPATSKKPLTAL